MQEVIRDGFKFSQAGAQGGFIFYTMLNVYNFMKDLPASKRLIVNDLVFAYYQCPLSYSRFDMWTHHDYFVYVMKRKKKWFDRYNKATYGTTIVENTYLQTIIQV